MRPHHLSRYATVALMIVGLAGCDGDLTGIKGINLTGTWAGTAVLPNGFSAGMTLTQSGASASGTMRVSGAFLDRNVTGTIDVDGRTFTWAVLDGCEVWGGILDISGDSQSMEGDLLIDRTGCVGQSNGTGTLRLSK